jgi:hypothetical protein
MGAKAAPDFVHEDLRSRMIEILRTSAAKRLSSTV